jgi:uncharacterized membrane protein YhhN
MPFSFGQKLLLALAIVAASTYLLTPLPEGSLANIIQKSSACIVLAGFAFWVGGRNRKTYLLCAALLISSVGDAFLAVRSTDMFVQGLGSFLIAHLLYTSLFVKARNWEKGSRTHKILVGIILVFAGLMISALWPELGSLKAPVFIYIAVITFMAVSALQSHYGAIWVGMGALSFLVSDSVIAINKFLMPADWASPTIWITYIAAQVLLTIGILKGPDSKTIQP